MDAQEREKQLARTRFAGELRQQFETAGTSAHARAQRPRRPRVVIALVAGIAIAIVLGGVAAAGGFDQLRKTIWPTNEQGQTYGSAGLAKSPDDEPDLIAVASDGKKGYCYKADLDGPPRGVQRRGATRPSSGAMRSPSTSPTARPKSASFRAGPVEAWAGSRPTGAVR